MRVLAALVLLGTAATSVQAAAASDWSSVCRTVGDFAGLVSAARDNKASAPNASAQAQQILQDPPLLVPSVAAEIVRQVYDTPSLTPTQENEALRTRCLTPDQPRPVVGPTRIEALEPIKLDVGDNRIAVPGGELDITLAWKDDGGGHGHDVFTAAMAGAGVVSMPNGDTVVDSPADDVNMRRSIRFARGQVNGTETILLLIAQRESGTGATATDYQVYWLEHDAAAYRFALLVQKQLSGTFCNADQALTVASGLPPRSSYRGLHTPNGCPPPSS